MHSSEAVAHRPSAEVLRFAQDDKTKNHLRQMWRPTYRQAAAEMLPSFARRADEGVRRYAINLPPRDHINRHCARYDWALTIG
jgi:hypothetical protein